MEGEMVPVNELSKEVSVVHEEKSFAKEALLLAGAILLGSFIIAGAILTLAPKAGTESVAVKGNDAQAVVPANQKPQDTSATTSLDDDPILGDRTKAKVAIVEFSDFECPFCKKFHADTFDALVKEYVATGKIVMVARDYPLSFHDPNATLEAALAECVRKEKGDSAYFAFSKSVYENTQANGKGLVAGKLNQLITKVGANVKTVNACAESDAVKQEIAKDIVDGGKAGVSGTPSFIIGTLDENGTVTGERVVGALPLSGATGFSTFIDKYLSK